MNASPYRRLPEDTGTGVRGSPVTGTVPLPVASVAPPSQSPGEGSVEWCMILAKTSCDSLGHTFGFQEHSVANQAEHVVSLWRSQIRQNEETDADAAMARVHSLLLSSSDRWGRRVLGRSATGRRESQTLAEAGAEKLKEICLFLLIWGEAGNLRFMPELLSFLFDAANTFRCFCHGKMPYDKNDRPATPVRPGDFLRFVVQPLYHRIFDETFSGLDAGGRPKFKFPGAAPADALNYDDINELFWDRKRLMTLVESSGNPVLGQDGPVFEQLCNVDWVRSLGEPCSGGRKTFREVHGWLAAYSGFFRILIAHLTAAGVLIAIELRSQLALAITGLVAPIVYTSGEFVGFFLCPNDIHVTRVLTRVVVLSGLVVASFVAWSVAPGRATFSVHIGLSLGVLVDSLWKRQWTDSTAFAPQITASPLQQRVLSMGFWGLAWGLKVFLDQAVLTPVLRAGDDIHIGVMISEISTVQAIAYMFMLCVPTLFSFLATLCLIQTGLVGVFGPIRGLFRFGKATTCGAGWSQKRMWRVPKWACEKVLGISVSDVASAPQLSDREMARLSQGSAAGRGSVRARDGLDSEAAAMFGKVWKEIVNEMWCGSLISNKERKALDPENRPSPLFDRLASTVVMPKGSEAQRRIITMARSLGMYMGGTPGKCKAANMPGITVLIPHYGETILLTKEDLLGSIEVSSGGASFLLGFLVEYYRTEFMNLVLRLEHVHEDTNLDLDFELRRWASNRTQTLWRTVEGVMKYQQAVELQLQAQGISEEASRVGGAERVRVLLAMQRYAVFNPKELEQTEILMETFPGDLCIAYIEDVQDGDAVNGRRFYSCMVNKSCQKLSNGRRQPLYRIELPGMPILGNGKGDNQNCAVIYTRGEFIQAVDANQEHYLEAAMLLSQALGEFQVERPGPDGKPLRPAILGFREHIFSCIGILGDVAAQSEFVFGTVTQRMMARSLDCRLHYGHPDILDKLQAIHQGGMSKATRGLNLSEDVFAGMDCVLRGGWTEYREYIHMGKGRDMGFNSILGFFAKLSMGTGEQCLTRESMRLGRGLPILRLFGYFYQHFGYYFNQFLMAHAIRLFPLMLMYFALDNAKHKFLYTAELTLGSFFGPLYTMFVLATLIPLVLELLLEEGIVTAMSVFLKDLMGLSFVFFTFQSKIIAYYLEQEVMYGGAKYVATGRGLPTVRDSFVTCFRSFAPSHMNDGAEIALLLTIAKCASGSLGGTVFAICVSVVVVSWCFGPFLYNPFQFRLRRTLWDIVAFWLWLMHAHPKTPIALPTGTDMNPNVEGWVAWQTGLQKRRETASRMFLLVPGMRLLGVMLMLVLVVPRGNDLGVPKIYLSILPAGLCGLLVLVFLCFLKRAFRIRRDQYASKISVALAMLLVWITVVAELVYCVKEAPVDLVWIVMMHKYFITRWLLDWGDWLLPPLGNCLEQGPGVFAGMLEGLSRWSMSLRLGRDAVMGTMILIPLVLLSAIPGLQTLHIMFLFRIKPRAAIAKSTEKPGTGVSEFFDVLISSADGWERTILQRCVRVLLENH